MKKGTFIACFDSKFRLVVCVTYIYIGSVSGEITIVVEVGKSRPVHVVVS